MCAISYREGVKPVDDPVADIARATAERLAPEHGERLNAEVEAALYARGTTRGPEQYGVDPIALASLIVSIATLAWTIYSDLRKEKPDIAPQVAERELRVELRRFGGQGPERDQVDEIIVTEIVRGGEHHR
jgi:hypothetical protein